MVWPVSYARETSVVAGYWLGHVIAFLWVLDILFVNIILLFAYFS